MLGTWAENSTVGRGGSTPSQRAIAYTPRNPLDDSEDLTTTQANSNLLERIRIQDVAMAPFHQELMRERIAVIARGHARRDLSKEFALGDQVDVYREPAQKDLVGWRGPAEVVNISRAAHGKVHIEWAGGTILVPLDHVRHHIISAFFAGRADSGMLELLR